ncbi:MAG: nitrate reductase molybdenum cofactor assembly chaperone [Rouxiella aceris]|uniref:nitrate reductase molybdenum cofactor assembly chaperone n=1 Tax=Rouxiella aceris TaxID=2703884 RepID=UPI002840913C|nr:nitrate reductase molybdenum cofactor assembly chaperone [Rouxiella aceris]MDR3430299.1 nitrate reductase molybdenum cofactor assembly chaperone [Rouxiella aceris]
MIALQIIARLLDYPDDALWAHRDELLSALADSQALDEENAAKLSAFIKPFCAAELLDRQAEYCSLFDRGRATSLLLFEHVHGESRDRGQAMVDLLDQYRAAGLVLDSKELPDYLPLYLEYLASLPSEEARSGLVDIAPILALLAARIAQRDSHYAVLFALLLAISGVALNSADVAEKLQQESRDDTPQALDAVWEEEQIKFLSEQGCASAEETAHSQRFAGAVAPQYINLDAHFESGTAGESRP